MCVAEQCRPTEITHGHALESFDQVKAVVIP